jgi:hypothetical protein
MGNHVHLLLVPHAADGLAKTLGRVHTDYSRWLNIQRGETGHVWIISEWRVQCPHPLLPFSALLWALSARFSLNRYGGGYFGPC